MTLTCPTCGQPIAEANVNMAQDAAFCAACGEMYKASVLSAAAQNGLVNPPVSVVEAAQPIPQAVPPPQAAPIQSVYQQPQYQQIPVQPYQQKMVDEAFCFSCGAVIKKDAEICPRCGVNQASRSKTTAEVVYCISCGERIKRDAEVCIKCGVRQTRQNGAAKSWSTLLILSILLGWLGADRFYAGHVGLGVLKLLTVGGCFVWWIIDVIIAATGNFKDQNGNVITKN